MAFGFPLALLLSLVAALGAIAVGRNFTRSIAGAGLSLVLLSVALFAAGAGFVALIFVIVAVWVLVVLQIFGWMLVDVDRDHLPSTDPMTWFARLLAFVLVGGGLVLFVHALVERGTLAASGELGGEVSPSAVGVLFFGQWGDLAALCGLALATGLLATLMLLREENGERR